MPMSVVYTNFCGRLIGETRGGVYSEYISDDLGNCIATVSATGKLTSRTDYWPYGEEIPISGTNPSPWGYVGLLGYYKDLSTKPLYVRARYLDTLRGQWFTRDMLWPRNSVNAYCMGSPVKISDPSGNNPPTIPFDEHGGAWKGHRSDVLNAFNEIARDPALKDFLACITCMGSGLGGRNRAIEDEVGKTLKDLLDSGKKFFQVQYQEGGYWPFNLGSPWSQGGNKCNDERICMFVSYSDRPLAIVLCQPRCFDTKKCGPLKCQLAHELIHIAGLSHDKQADIDACFNSVQKLAGCENYKPTNVGHKFVK